MIISKFYKSNVERGMQLLKKVVLERIQKACCRVPNFLIGRYFGNMVSDLYLYCYNYICF